MKFLYILIRSFSIYLFAFFFFTAHCIEKVPEVSKTVEIPELGLILNYEGWLYEEFDPNADPKNYSQSKTKKPIKNDQPVKVMFYLFDSDKEKGSEIRTNINFISEAIPSKYSKATLEDYVASIGALYSNMYKDYEVLSVPQRCAFGKNKCMFVEAKFKLTNSDKSKEVHTFQWIFLKESSFYIFTGTVPENELGTKGKKIIGTIQTLSESKTN
ncbi:hypothetical protein EHQ53_05515 [Leptospira langatensis]|uniref:Lipoprotein n=1 Tax=Leptospira langatensis TaxID=2484983 RepID=A0A5F1ZT06_9LEPT|nr:hypothetical protein [Leptospira langatensis]TGK02924.1 hypothetical protein EHO57_06350 [Leptospira langatensis]TGL41679.1 hypothetical protein EHQ53_05515 [Leptospira langatensis]